MKNVFDKRRLRWGEYLHDASSKESWIASLFIDVALSDASVSVALVFSFGSFYSFVLFLVYYFYYFGQIISCISFFVSC